MDASTSVVGKGRGSDEEDLNVKRNKIDGICEICDPNPFMYAVKHNHLNCMKTYLSNHDIPRLYGKFEGALQSSTAHQDGQMMRFLIDTAKERRCIINIHYMADFNAVEMAAYHCNIECLKLAHAYGFPFGRAMASAICGELRTRNSSCVDFLQENGCPFMPQFLSELEIDSCEEKDLWLVINFLEKHNYNDWETELGIIIYQLLKKGFFDLVDYLSLKKCPWPEENIFGNILVRFAKWAYRNTFLYIYNNRPSYWSTSVLKRARNDQPMLEFIFLHCEKNITLADIERYYPHKLR